jgi:hypothetical protein
MVSIDIFACKEPGKADAGNSGNAFLRLRKKELVIFSRYVFMPG